MKQQTQSVPANPADKVAKSATRELISERDGKRLYHSEKPDLIIQEFVALSATDDVAGNNATSGQIVQMLRNEISSYFFEYIEGFRIPTNFVGRCSDSEMFVRTSEVFPIIVRVYNASVGSFAKRLSLKEGQLLEFPVLEHYYTNEGKASMWANEYHLFALGVLTPDDFRQINRIATKTNAVLRSLCERRQLMLVDLKLEFSKHKGQILLADELSPLTCHIWDMTHDAKNGRDRFLLDRDQPEVAITELRNRLLLKP